MQDFGYVRILDETDEGVIYSGEKCHPVNRLRKAKIYSSENYARMCTNDSDNPKNRIVKVKLTVEEL